jgi:hypothetical protein
MVWGGGWGSFPNPEDLEIVNLVLTRLGSEKITAFSDKADIMLEELYENTRDSILQLYPWKFARARTRLNAAGILDASTSTITFANADPDTITDSNSLFVIQGFEEEGRVKIVGSGSNNTTFKLNTVVASTIVLEPYETAVAEVLTNDTDLKLYALPSSGFEYKYEKSSDMLKVLDINDRKMRWPSNLPIDRIYNSYPAGRKPWKIEGNFIATNDIDDNDQIVVEYTQKITDPAFFEPAFVQMFHYQLVANLVGPLKKDLDIETKYEEKAKDFLLDYAASQAGEGGDDEEPADSSWNRAGRGGSNHVYGDYTRW